MIEVDSLTWKTIELWIASEEKNLIDDLRSPGVNYDRTQFVRGRLAQLDVLRELPNQIKFSHSKPVI